jgi:hypothetical protein
VKRLQRPGWLRILLATSGGFLLGVLLIVALGGVVQDHTRYVIHVHTHTRTQTEVQTVTVIHTHTEKTPPPRNGEVTVPDLVGAELDAAQAQLENLGLQDDENGGGAFGVIDPSNWQVVDQDPRAGSHVDAGSVVELDIERS